MVNFAQIGKLFFSSKVAPKVLGKTAVMSNPIIKSGTNAATLVGFEKNISSINSTTQLGIKKSTELFNYLPKEAQENFDTLLSAGKRLGYIKTDPDGNILSGSIERFLTVLNKNSYGKMLYLEQNFPQLEHADFKKLFNVYKNPKKMAANKENIQKWLQQKEELKNISKTLEQEGKEKVAQARQDIIDVLGIEPKCRSKSFESIYDKISKEVLKGGEIKDISQARKAVRDLVGTRLILDDVSPEAMQKIVDNLCKGIENGKLTPYRISNYAKESRRYLSEEQFKQIQTAAAKKGIEIPRIESDQISATGYVTAQTNFIHSNGVLGEIQIRGKLMHKYAEWEHIIYDIRMGKNLGKNIPELEKFLEPLEDAVLKLERNGLNKVYDKYIHDCYKYVRKYEEGKIKGAFRLPKFPKKLRDYQILKFDNLGNIEQKMVAIKNKYAPVAQVA